MDYSKLTRLTAVFIVGVYLSSCNKQPTVVQTTPAPTPQPIVSLPSTPVLPTPAMDLITNAEVGATQSDHSYYDKEYAKPTYGGGDDSGVTIAIGVDLSTESSSVITTSWSPYFVIDTVNRLAACTAITGNAAKSLVKDLRDISINWNTAIGEFNGYELPNYWALTRRTFPGFDNLTLNAKGALISTVYNRGASLSGSSRVDFRNIKKILSTTPIDYQALAACYTHMEVTMQSSWQAQGIYDGLKARYDATAVLTLTPDH